MAFAQVLSIIDAPNGGGAFALGRPADVHVHIAGGIGITPAMSLLRKLADRGDPPAAVLFHGSKDLASMTFRQELGVLRSRLYLRLVPVPADAPPGWSGGRGRIDAAPRTRHLPSAPCAA